MFLVCTLFTLIIIALLVFVTGYLMSIGVRSVDQKLFITAESHESLDPSVVPAGDLSQVGGMANGLEGTIVLIFLASLIGIPVGMLAGVFLAEYGAGSKLAAPARFTADVLTGVPSIVVGILGYELFVIPLGGNNGWAGALSLAFIMVPIVARTAEEMLRLVPDSYREASMALGATKANTILRDYSLGRGEHRNRHHVGHRTSRRRDGAAAVHGRLHRFPADSD